MTYIIREDDEHALRLWIGDAEPGKNTKWIVALRSCRHFCRYTDVISSTCCRCRNERNRCFVCQG